MIRTILRVARVPLLVLAVALGCGPAGVFADDSSTQHWKGVVTLPGGMKLDFTVNLGPDGGRISIPMQGARDLPLRNGAADGNSLKFTLAAPGAPENAWAKFDMTVSDDGAQAEGTLSQAGQQFPVSMTRLTAEQAAATELKRPQTPVPPLPYEERAVEFKSEAGGVTIAGTLTVPVGDGPHPAVVLITGSGAQDRDESIMGHKPFMVWADYLTRRGIAVLRTDDRGIGGSGGNSLLAKEEDLAADAAAGVAFVRTQPGIDPERVGVMGHSEGGAIAPLVAVKADGVRFVVMLAGYAMRGSELLRIQNLAIMRGGGIQDEEALARVAAAHRAAMEAVMNDAPHEEGIRALAELIRVQLAANGTEMGEDELRLQAGQQYSTLLTPWFRSFLSFDPSESLKRVRVPVLAIVGERDLQVPHADALPGIRAALEEAGNNDVTIATLPGLNHLLQACTTGGMDEYAAIEETINPAALEMVGDWLRLKAGLN